MDEITSKTNIKLFDILAAAPFVIGGIVWLSVMNSKVEAQSEQISEIKQHQKEIVYMFTDIRERLIRLEEQTKNQKQGR